VLPALTLVTALGLVGTGYAVDHGLLDAPQLVSLVTRSATDAEPPGTGAASHPAAGHSSPATRATPTRRVAAAAASATATATATAATAAPTRDRVMAAGVVAMPGPPAPPPYPWLSWSWATATAYAHESCMPRYRPGSRPGMTVTTKGSTVVVTWMHNGDPAVLTYWLGWHIDPGTRVQQTKPIQWQKVTPPTACTGVTTTLPTLTSGHYRLWMEMDAATPQLPGTQSSRVGLSETTFDIP
jgi:hypothetical protein